ncbi:MAG TPA: hypothetical protein DEP87_01590 [Candidatus Pacebacteria bacterium]|nr:hypothetical protein [Candidatus Paceibacterota bacterium]
MTIKFIKSANIAPIFNFMTQKNSTRISPSSSLHRLPVRVGFDLDGVLLYNPVRNFRPLISWFKKVFLHRRKIKFFVPKSAWQQQVFIWLHQTSLWVAPGLAEIKALKAAGLIEPYLITARFGFLRPDTQRWLKALKAETVFTEICINDHDQQPFIFKAQQIKRLKLEMFVEDNWDIVKKLQELVLPDQPNFVCWWVSNILDWPISYRYKVKTLQQAVMAMGQKLQQADLKSRK